MHIFDYVTEENQRQKDYHLTCRYSGYKYPEKVIYALIAIFLIVLVGPMILGFLHTMYNVKGETDWRKVPFS
jgi:hypothetical protein